MGLKIKKKRSCWITNISLTCISLILMIFLLEISFRFTDYRILLQDNRKSLFKNYYTISQPYQNLEIAPNRPKKMFIFSGESGHEMWSNNIGCFDQPHNINKPYAIYLAGDSFTWGYAPFERKYGTLIEKYMGRRVVKAGVGATGTKSQFYRAKKIIKKIGSPELLIVGYYIGNDLINDYLFPGTTMEEGYLVPKRKIVDIKSGKIISLDREKILKQIRLIKKYGYGTKSQPKYPTFHKINHYFSKNSVLWALLKRSRTNVLHILNNQEKIFSLRTLLSSKSARNSYSPMFGNAKWFEKAYLKSFESIKMFKSFCKDNNIKLLFVLIPKKNQVYPFMSDYTTLELEQPNIKLSEFFKKEDILYLDLLPLFKQKVNLTPRKNIDPKKDLYWRYDTHWNEKGNLLAGLLITKFILEKNLVDIEDKGNKLKFIHNKLEGF